MLPPARSIWFLAFSVLRSLLIQIGYASAISEESKLNDRDNVGHQSFKTEPEFLPQQFVRSSITKNGSLLSPGYIFLGLMDKKSKKWGPRIYDHNGNIIWYGSSSVGKTRITDFHPCDYLGLKHSHLCWHDQFLDPSSTSKRSLVKKVILDNTYSLVQNYTIRGNSHEFHIVDNGTKFLTIDYKTKPWDLQPHCGKKNGWIEDACIVEYDIRTGKETWDWCFTDHLPVYESAVYFIGHDGCQTNATVPKAGRGTKKTPWDIGHLNSVDKNSAGDYIASFRHLDEVMKIAGLANVKSTPGTILWRLGGKGNQFEKTFNFSRQHMIRFVEENLDRNQTIIALFNNAWEGVLAPSSEVSSGQIIRLDTYRMKAELLYEYPHPYGKLSASRGSMQVLPNGNAFIGWGNLPDVSEFSGNGSLVFNAQFADYKTAQYSYRAFKSPWKGNPTWPPKLVAYSHTCRKSRPLFAYVSWNGATEVSKWRFQTASDVSGPWISAGTFAKTGFETRARLNDSIARYVFVEALDSKGIILGNATQAAFIPDQSVARKCDAYGCPNHFLYDGKLNGQACNFTYMLPVFALILLAILPECFTLLAEYAIRASIEPQMKLEGLIYLASD